MIFGAHVVLFSRDAEADRAFLGDVLGVTGVDTGGGWLVFALPPAEVAVHPTGDEALHELFLLCDDVHGEVADLASRGVTCSEVTEQSWGWLTYLSLPGGGRVGLYQPTTALALVRRGPEEPSREGRES